MALRELRIANVAVVAEASVQVEPSFSVLTGETGAGKSVCLSALRIGLGGRADPEIIRQGCDTARVAAVFDAVPEAVRAKLRDLGVPDDDLTTLSRQINRGGRGSSRINGALVSHSAFRDVGDQLVEITSQGASQRLLRSDAQRALLDAAAGETARDAKNMLAAAVRDWSAAARRLESARHAASSNQSELSAARDTVAELSTLHLRVGEEQELAAERLRLRHAAGIASAAALLADATGADEDGAADLLARAAGPAARLAALDAPLRELAAAADDIVERLHDLHRDALRCAAECVVDDARLAAVEERLDCLARVGRRYGGVEDALSALETAERTLDAVGAGADGLRAGEERLDEARKRAGAAAAVLSAIRRDAAPRLERAVTHRLQQLALPQARFRVVLGVSPHPDGAEVDGELLRCTAQGVDEVEFRFAASRSVMPMPLGDGPSGGELSRLALALSAVISDSDAPALVLDEIDTGIGGETAAAVGDVLASIGASRQVIAVTHRPEIASRARHHVCVSKQTGAGAAATTLRCLYADDRLREIARLMSGRVTDAALRRAAELLQEGSGAGRARAAGGAGR